MVEAVQKRKSNDLNQQENSKLVPQDLDKYAQFPNLEDQIINNRAYNRLINYIFKNGNPPSSSSLTNNLNPMNTIGLLNPIVGLDQNDQLNGLEQQQFQSQPIFKSNKRFETASKFNSNDDLQQIRNLLKKSNELITRQKNIKKSNDQFDYLEFY